MTKKTKLVNFDLELYQKGAKAVFENNDNYEIHSIIISKYSETKGSVIYYDEDKDICSCSYYTIENPITFVGRIMLEVENKEKEFWVNVYQDNNNNHMFGAPRFSENDARLETAGSNRILGMLEITYTDEDLIK